MAKGIFKKANASSAAAETKIRVFFSGYSETGIQYINARNLWCLINGPYASAKTSMSIGKIFIEACLQPAGYKGIRESRGIVIRSTYDNLLKSVISDLDRWIPSEFGSVSRGSNLVGEYFFPNFVLNDGSDVSVRLDFKSEDNGSAIEALGSTQYGFAWLSEMRELSERWITFLPSRLGRFPDAPSGAVCKHKFIMGDFNMPSKDHWLYRFVMSGNQWTEGKWIKGVNPKIDYFQQPAAVFCDNLEAVEADADLPKWRINRNADNLNHLQNLKDVMSDEDIAKWRLSKLKEYEKDGAIGGWNGDFASFDRFYFPNGEYDEKAGGIRFYEDQLVSDPSYEQLQDIKANLMMIWCSRSGGKLVYGREFDGRKHIAQETQIVQPGASSILIGIDPSGHHPAAVICEIIGGSIIVLDELSVPGDICAMQPFLNDMLLPLMTSPRYAPYRNLVSVVVDPSNQRNSFNLLSPIEQLTDAGFNTMPAPTNDPKSRISSVVYALKTNSLLINPSCRELIKGFETDYVYKKLRGGAGYGSEPDKGEASHLQDALQYVCSAVYNMGKQAQVDVVKMRRNIKESRRAVF